jgi:hypothetical protein
LENEKHKKWYFKTSSLIIAFVCLGPFALPMLWFNPAYSIKKKVIISAIIIILSYFLTVQLINSIKSLTTYYDTIFNGPLH